MDKKQNAERLLKLNGDLRAYEKKHGRIARPVNCPVVTQPPLYLSVFKKFFSGSKT